MLRVRYHELGTPTCQHKVLALATIVSVSTPPGYSCMCRAIPEFSFFKRLYLWNHRSFEVELLHEYSTLATSSAHFLLGQGDRARHLAFENHHFMPHFGSSPLGTCSSL